MDPDKAFKYDLRVIHSGFVANGKHTKTTSPKKEALCVSKSLDLVGLVAITSKEGLLVQGLPLDENSVSLAEFGLDATGAIFTLYRDGEGRDRWFCGTGFKVSPTIVATEAHVCASDLKFEGKDYSLQAVYISFQNDLGPVVHGNIPTSPFFFRLQVIEPPPFHPLVYGYTRKNGSFETWDPSDDFCFLVFADNRTGRLGYFNQFSFVYPIISPFVPHGDSIVIGFPGRLKEREFKNDYPEKEYPGLNFDDICDTFGGFDRKSVSFGITTQETYNLLHHNAPTIPGISGGLFLAHHGNKAAKGFSGIHVGGATEINQNFAIPTTNVNLALYYFKAISIATEDFRSMEPARLQSYYNHFNAQLPQEIHAKFNGFFV